MISRLFIAFLLCCCGDAVKSDPITRVHALSDGSAVVELLSGRIIKLSPGGTRTWAVMGDNVRDTHVTDDVTLVQSRTETSVRLLALDTASGAQLWSANADIVPSRDAVISTFVLDDSIALIVDEADTGQFAFLAAHDGKMRHSGQFRRGSKQRLTTATGSALALQDVTTTTLIDSSSAITVETLGWGCTDGSLFYLPRFSGESYALFAYRGTREEGPPMRLKHDRGMVLESCSSNSQTFLLEWSTSQHGTMYQAIDRTGRIVGSSTHSQGGIERNLGSGYNIKLRELEPPTSRFQVRIQRDHANRLVVHHIDTHSARASTLSLPVGDARVRSAFYKSSRWFVTALDSSEQKLWVATIEDSGKLSGAVLVRSPVLPIDPDAIGGQSMWLSERGKGLEGVSRVDLRTFRVLNGPVGLENLPDVALR